MSSLELKVSNFRILNHLEWQLHEQDVCLLVGANGTGKSTVLKSLTFMRELFLNGYESAIDAVDGGTGAFANSRSNPDTPVRFSIKVKDILWDICFQTSARRITGEYDENLFQHRQGANAVHEGELHLYGQGQCFAKRHWDCGKLPWMKPLVRMLEHTRIHGTYCLKEIRNCNANGAGMSLDSTGCNLWSVLNNWQASPGPDNRRFNWVLSEARRAFPGIIDDIRFDSGIPHLIPHGATDSLDGIPASQAADSLITGLLHLTAVAGMSTGGLLAIDELENHLHPHAIRSIIRAMRQQAEERDLTIIITTHSLAALNQFRLAPEQVYVLGHGNCTKNTPASIEELHHEDWFALADPGSLYDELAFAAPDMSFVPGMEP